MQCNYETLLIRIKDCIASEIRVKASKKYGSIKWAKLAYEISNSKEMITMSDEG